MDFRRILLENWTIKLASLVLAVALWLYATSTGKTEISVTAPLELRGVPAGMVVVGEVAGRVEVRLQGQERALRDISTGKKVIGTADLSRCREGENRIHLSPDDISKPPGVSVTYLSPSEIGVRLERLVQRTVRLQPVVEGRPAAGFRVAGVAVRPPRATVEGPASVIRTLTVLRTIPIDIEGAADSMKAEPRIEYEGRPVKVLEQDISVTITIIKEQP